MLAINFQFQLEGQSNVDFYDANGSYELHGEQIIDPFLKMEDKINSKEIETWKKKQVDNTIQQIEKMREYDLIRGRLLNTYNSEISLPYKIGNYLYEISKEDDYNFFIQDTFYAWQKHIISPDFPQTKIKYENKDNQINNFKISSNSHYAAIEIAIKGSDKMAIVLIDMKNNKQMLKNDISTNPDGNFCWRDSTALFYTKDSSIYLHILNSQKDSLIYEGIFEDFVWNEATHSFVIRTYYEFKDSTKIDSLLYYRFTQETPVRKSIKIAEANSLELLGNIDKNLFFYITAPNGCSYILKWDGQETEKRLIEGNNMVDAFLYYNKIVLIFEDNQSTKHYNVYDEMGILWGESHTVGQKEIRNIRGFANDSLWVYTTRPLLATDDTFHIINLSVKEHIRIPYPKQASKYENKRVTYQANGGTMIEMDIFYSKEIKNKMGKKAFPLLLKTYGGYGLPAHSVDDFDAGILFWLSQGNILAIPHVRGGAYPTNKDSLWWQKGQRENKARAIDDFIAAANWLISSNFTNKSLIACTGYSHGAMVAAAAITRQPSLFRVAILENGLYDMFRYRLPIYGYNGGDYWLEEFGDAGDTGTVAQKDFQAQKQYSPYYKLRSLEEYPATFCITSQNDDRVSPLHSYKFIACLQHIQPQAQHFLYVKKGGHESFNFEDEVYKYTFLFEHLNIKVE